MRHGIPCEHANRVMFSRIAKTLTIPRHLQLFSRATIARETVQISAVRSQRGNHPILGEIGIFLAAHEAKFTRVFGMALTGKIAASPWTIIRKFKLPLDPQLLTALETLTELASILRQAAAASSVAFAEIAGPARE